MVDILDYLMIAGRTYYIMTKVKDENDDGAKRMLIGIGVGLLAGYKGPELYKKMTELKNTPEGRISRDRLLAAGIGAGAGYIFGDKLMGTAKRLGAKKEDFD